MQKRRKLREYSISYRSYHCSPYRGCCRRFLYGSSIYDEYLKENPPINEDMLRMMMTQMGRKPSEKQVRQVMSQMNKATDQQLGKKNKK